MAAKHRFGEKATPGLVNEKAKRALQNMSNEGRGTRRGVGRAAGDGGDSLDSFAGRDSD